MVKHYGGCWYPGANLDFGARASATITTIQVGANQENPNAMPRNHCTCCFQSPNTTAVRFMILAQGKRVAYLNLVLIGTLHDCGSNESQYALRVYNVACRIRRSSSLHLSRVLRRAMHSAHTLCVLLTLLGKQWAHDTHAHKGLHAGRPSLRALPQDTRPSWGSELGTTGPAGPPGLNRLLDTVSTRKTSTCTSQMNCCVCK